MNEAVYARTSTVGQTTQQQLDRLREAAPGAVEYVDDAVSGRLDSRPAFDRLREEIRARRVSTVHVCRIGRLGRSARGILEFFDLAESHGVRVLVVDQAVDTSTPVGKVVRTILAALAELEADLIRDRTRGAMAAFKIGTRTPKGPVGRPRRLTPDLEQKIRELRTSGLKWSVVAQHVGLPAGTCRKVKTAPLPDTLRVENPLRQFGTQSDGT